MSKSKKIKSNIEKSNRTDMKSAFGQFNWRLAGKLLLSFAVIFGLYQVLLNIAETNKNPAMQEMVMIIYSVATTVVACIFIVLNRGISNDIPTKEQLRDDWSDEKKLQFIEKYTESKKKAKKWLIVLIPLLFTLLFDTLYLLFMVK